MGENNDTRIAPKSFILDVIYGYAIGTAFIIPGFSGGSIAAILGIYERLVSAIADIFKSFKKSVLTLLPIGIGMIAGIISLLYPLGWALAAYPFPTVSLFVGLALGGLPSITANAKGKFKPIHVLSLAVPLLLAVSLSFLPIGADVDLFGLNFGGYLLLVLIGLIGSAALVVPGISGSMLLLILGYYNPILQMVTDHLFKGDGIGTSILVLGCTGVGIGIGFFLISFIMKWLLRKHQRGTYIAIIGFILGSVPSIFISTAKDAGYTLSTLPSSPWYWTVAVAMLALGCAISLSLIFIAKKRKA
ncbi:MAG: DUF368 domain-containing protein [Clostridia bacterium]|nr:DUF368 domain-containing protein [Clostridia bacterium]